MYLGNLLVFKTYNESTLDALLAQEIFSP